MSYMRMSKVLAAFSALSEMQYDLTESRIFDYGFGAGTLFRHCPKTSGLFGVEIDVENVKVVSEMLRTLGYSQVDLQPVSVDSWKEHPLLKGGYDLVVCSHVLEHLDAPIDFLTILRRCLGKDSLFLGVVPINELAQNPHHLHSVDRDMIQRWANDANMDVCLYREFDPLSYHLQPLFTFDTGWKHRLAQTISMSFGVASSILGHRRWWKFNDKAGKLIGGRPTQAAFVLKRVAD